MKVHKNVYARIYNNSDKQTVERIFVLLFSLSVKLAREVISSLKSPAVVEVGCNIDSLPAGQGLRVKVVGREDEICKRASRLR